MAYARCVQKSRSAPAGTRRRPRNAAAVTVAMKGIWKGEAPNAVSVPGSISGTL